MRKRILIAMGAGVLLFGALTILYFLGWWIPNDPNPSTYPVRGIDVSRHQGRIDWKAVSTGGIRFVYLKATEGGDLQDAAFKENVRAVHDAGMACGAYHFFSLKTPGIVQAQNFIQTVPSGLVTLPPVVDLEFWGNSSERPPPESFQVELRAYLDAVSKAYGREPVIYTSADFSSVYLKNFPIRRFWVRDILLSPTWDGTRAWLFWQFSEKGRVPGVEGFVDLDVFNGGEDRFNALVRNAATP
jgi:lysozyme